MPVSVTRGLQTEFEFTLPRGYVDEAGNLHKKGVMRLATAPDEIVPLRDPRVKRQPGLPGDHAPVARGHPPRDAARRQINPAVIEKLFSADLAYLQDFYRRINETGHRRLPATCPECATRSRSSGRSAGAGES